MISQLPTVGALLVFSVCFYFVAIAFRTIPMGIAYAIWAGGGIILTALIGTFVMEQKIDTAALIGIGFIIVGVLVINLFSHSSAH